MSRIGPLKNIWCMRYESKHQEYKLSCNVSKCRKNLTYSLSLKNQLRFCFNLIAYKIVPDKIIAGPGQTMNTRDLMDFKEVSMFPHTLNLNKECTFVNWVLLDGKKLTLNCIITHTTIEDEPMFYVIQYICIQEEIYFICTGYEVINFDKHFFAYKVKKIEKLHVLEAKMITDLYHNSLKILPNGCTYINMRNML